jgi:ABC-type phosphate transport system substrate-binding protein
MNKTGRRGFCMIRKYTLFSLLCSMVCLILSFPCIQAASASDFVIIAHQGIAETELSSGEIKDIFMGRIVKWKNGAKIMIAVLNESDMHAAFVKKTLERSPSQFRNLWKQMVFTGKGKFPNTFKTEEELIEYVRKTEGATGYATKGKTLNGVKVFKIE